MINSKEFTENIKKFFENYRPNEPFIQPKKINWWKWIILGLLFYAIGFLIAMKWKI